MGATAAKQARGAAASIERAGRAVAGGRRRESEEHVGQVGRRETWRKRGEEEGCELHSLGGTWEVFVRPLLSAACMPLVVRDFGTVKLGRLSILHRSEKGIGQGNEAEPPSPWSFPPGWPCAAWKRSIRAESRKRASVQVLLRIRCADLPSKSVVGGRERVHGKRARATI